MALKPDSEKPDLSSPEDYRRDHPDEHPSDWGWHGEWGRGGRIAGWVVVGLLLVMLTSTWYNFSGPAWLLLIAAAIVAGLEKDYRRRSALRWRAHGYRPSVGLSVFIIVVGLILQFAPRDQSRVLALSIIAAVISIVGAFCLTLRLTHWR